MACFSTHVISVEQKAQSGLDGKVGIFQQLSEELPPPPPQSPPPPQHESKVGPLFIVGYL